MTQLLDIYLNVTKRTNDGHCGMEAETYLQFVQHVARSFYAEVNEETTWTGDHMESYLMVRTESKDFVAVKHFLVLGLIQRGYDIEVVQMHADGDSLEEDVVIEIMRMKPPKQKKKKGLVGLVKQFMARESAVGDVVPDAFDEEHWEEEEEDE